MQLHYFDFDPPPGWNGFRVAAQVRLIPPNTPPAEARCAIVVAPLVPRSRSLPAADALIEQTLAAEVQATGARVLSKEGPAPFKTGTGLAGISFDVRVEQGTSVERRLYVLLVDDLCYYSINYLAAEDVFDTHAETFWSATRSIKPFEGRIVPPIPGALDHYSE